MRLEMSFVESTEEEVKEKLGIEKNKRQTLEKVCLKEIEMR